MCIFRHFFCDFCLILFCFFFFCDFCLYSFVLFLSVCMCMCMCLIAESESGAGNVFFTPRSQLKHTLASLDNQAKILLKQKQAKQNRKQQILSHSLDARVFFFVFLFFCAVVLLCTTPVLFFVCVCVCVSMQKNHKAKLRLWQISKKKIMSFPCFIFVFFELA